MHDRSNQRRRAARAARRHRHNSSPHFRIALPADRNGPQWMRAVINGSCPTFSGALPRVFAEGNRWRCSSREITVGTPASMRIRLVHPVGSSIVSDACRGGAASLALFRVARTRASVPRPTPGDESAGRRERGPLSRVRAAPPFASAPSARRRSTDGRELPAGWPSPESRDELPPQPRRDAHPR